MRTFIVPETGSAAQKASFAEVLAVHAALLHTGKIVFFSGDEHDPGRYSLGMFDHARLFDCSTLAISSPTPAPTIRDLFCCGHAFLANGKLLVGGGTEAWTITLEGGADPHGHAGAGHFRGTADAYVFDPAVNAWDQVSRMVYEPGYTSGGGRWYPTLLTLGDGRVLAISGHPSDSDTRHYNDTVEAFSVAPSPDGHWSDIGSVTGGEITYYARGHLLQDGTVFFSSPIGGQNHRFNPHTSVWTTVSAGPPAPYDGFSTNSVLLPLLPETGYRARVLIAGATTAKVIDLGAAAPSWQNTGPRTLSVGGTPPNRSHCSSVILPTGEVALIGGFRDPGQDPTTAVLPIEVFHPATNSWVTMPTAANCTVPRNYHSVALLMPDGRVWMAGGNKHASWSYHEPGDYPTSLPTSAQDDAIDNRELRIEIFEPWYFGRPDRPTISNAPTHVSVGASFSIATPQAATVSRVAVVRAGSATHAFNPDQRYVGLPYTVGSGSLSVTVPDNENLLPPGYYLLFVSATIVDPTGATFDVPSVGRFIRIGNGKIFKELKLEFDKPLYLEIKEIIPELKTLPPEVKDVKGEVEGFEKPWEWVVDPATVIRELAARLDNLERRQAVGKAFIPEEVRPEVSSLARPRVIGRTQQRTLEQLLMDEHPPTQERTAQGHGDAHDMAAHDMGAQVEAPRPSRAKRGSPPSKAKEPKRRR